MLLRKLSLFAVVLLVSEIAWAQTTTKPPNWDDLAEDAASTSGNPHGFGALSRLPPVRIVVYDPVSNAFGFVRSTDAGRSKSTDQVTAYNQDYLDRERLALTTQKIRLLILPYNSRTTHLTLVKTNGHGVEFKALFSAPATETKQADVTTPETDKTKTTPPPNTENAGVPKQNAAANQRTANNNWMGKKSEIQSGLQSTLREFTGIIAPDQASFDASKTQSVSARTKLNTETSDLVMQTKGPSDVLVAVSAFFDEYRDRVVAIESNIDSVRTGTHCLHDSLSLTEGNVTRKLAAVDQEDLLPRHTRFRSLTTSPSPM